MQQTDVACKYSLCSFLQKKFADPCIYEANWNILMGIKKDNTVRCQYHQQYSFLKRGTSVCVCTFPKHNYI